MQIRNPCKKCLVRPMCKKNCGIYENWVDKAAYFTMFFTGIVTCFSFSLWFLIGYSIDSFIGGFIGIIVFYLVSYLVYNILDSMEDFVSDVFDIDSKIMEFILSPYVIILVTFVNLTKTYAKSR